jgi:hypothetical protein
MPPEGNPKGILMGPKLFVEVLLAVRARGELKNDVRAFFLEAGALGAAGGRQCFSPS